MKGEKCCAEDMKWRAEEDVRLIQRYNELKADKKRYSAATKRFEEIIDEYQKVLNSENK